MRRKGKVLTSLLLALMFLLIPLAPAIESRAAAAPYVKYCTFSYDKGWQAVKQNGQVAGNVSGKKVEAFRVNLINGASNGIGISYRANLADVGWTSIVGRNSISGSTTRKKPVYAVSMKLTGANAANFHLWYRVRVADLGWLDWAKDGAYAGTSSYKGVIAMQVKLLSKDAAAPGATTRPYVTKSTSKGVHVEYTAHVQDIGWQDTKIDGQTAGTSGKFLRMEALRIQLTGIDYDDLHVMTKAHVENIGWQKEVKEGQMSGTQGKSLQMEALQLRLEGKKASDYQIYYRVHVQNLGWLAWAKSGEIAGSTGFKFRIEAIQIKIAPKSKTLSLAKGDRETSCVESTDTKIYYQPYLNGAWKTAVASPKATATGSAMQGFKAKIQGPIKGTIRYKTQVAGVGWTGWRTNNTASAESAKGKNIEAISIELQGEIAGYYDIFYRARCANFGWLPWAKNGNPAGTKNYGYRMEAVQIKLVPKSNPDATAEGKAYRIKDEYKILGSFSTVSQNTANGTFNMMKALAEFNGITIQPGQTLSFNGTTGYCGAANGYRLAAVVGGTGYGGGVCQASTTLYGAAARAGLTIVERHNHSVRSVYVPVGQDAMINYGTSDLRIKNPYSKPVKIVTWTEGKTLHAEIWGTDPGWFDSSTVRSWATGAHSASAERIFYKDGKEVKRESLPSSYYSRE